MPHRAANRLLGSPTDAELRRWRRAAEPVRLKRGQALEMRGGPSGHVWFPDSATVSILYAMADGASGEIALIGAEGLVGRSLPPGLGTARHRAVVSGAGDGHRVPAALVVEEIGREGPFARALARFTETLVAQVSQLVACNRHHRLEQQLCRLLLSSLDLSGNRRLETTHEWLATRLGVRREGVTAALGALRDAGTVEARRGRVEVLDRAALEAASCECQAAIVAERERLLG